MNYRKKTSANDVVRQVLGSERCHIVRGLDMGTILSKTFGISSSNETSQAFYPTEERYQPLQS